MRVQTYARWVHQPASHQEARTAGQAVGELAGFIDDLIAQVAYYPSFTVQVTSDAEGRLLVGAQRVVFADEQPDGMITLRTPGASICITHAAYQRLLA